MVRHMVYIMQSDKGLYLLEKNTDVFKLNTLENVIFLELNI